MLPPAPTPTPGARPRSRRRSLGLAAGALPLGLSLLPARAAVTRAATLVEGVELIARQVRQGNSVFVRLWAPGAVAASATFEGQDVPLLRAGGTGGPGEPGPAPFVGLLGTPRAATPGPRRVRFRLTAPDGHETLRDDPADVLHIVDAGYPVYRIQMPASSTALLDPAKVQAENRFLAGVYGQWAEERSWRVPFVPPAGDVRITAGFGDRWSINGAPAGSVHEGTDYGCFTGHPIRAAAAGRVAFAGPLHVRGNVVVVDHGWGVMTGYFHLSELRVEEGQPVEAGAGLALSGATGFVNGAHLHFEVRVHNVNVEPLEWLGSPRFPRPELAGL